MNHDQLTFAPLIRVSTERQEKQGESLHTQRSQLTSYIESLNGTVYKWYAGQEHATPDQERKILSDLIEDAQNRRFDAVMVCDVSRWSRDNGRSKGDLQILKQNGIRFYVGNIEYNLYEPNQELFIGMGVEINEFFAKTQSHKALINSISKAKKGYPTKGRLPYGRLFDKKTGKWSLDEKEVQKLKYAIDQYLNGASMTTDLPKILNRSVSSVWRIFNQSLGDTYQIEFDSEQFNIHETVTLNIPRIVDDETIEKVKQRLSANKLYKHKPLKNKYLLSRMIFCENCGFALVGITNAGYRYYRHQPFRRCSSFASIRADKIESLVMTDIISNFGDIAALEESMKLAIPDLEKRKELEEQQNNFKSELEKISVQKSKIIDFIADGLISKEDVKSKMDVFKEKESFFKEEISKIDYQLETIPSEKHISMKAELLHRAYQEYLRYDKTRLDDMTYEEKKNLLQHLFSGKTPDGKRQGVYINSPKGIYTIKGNLHDIIGDLDYIVNSVDSD